MSMMMADRNDADFDPKRSRWIPWAIVGFFGVVIAVNLVMLWFALGTFNGLSYKEAYDRGVHYNETLARQEAQQALGWQVELGVETPGAKRADITLVLADKSGAPIAYASVNGALVRPVQEGNDMAVSLDHRGGGRYEASVAAPLPGQWDLDLLVVAGDDAYRLRQRIMIEE
jgi:nitrogen fixation protein FixH